MNRRPQTSHLTKKKEKAHELLKQALGILNALVVLAVIVAFVAPNRARAVAATLVQIVPGNTTHVGQAESRLVSLECIDGKAYCSQIDVEAKGDESTPYVVPNGYTLIVTDYEWQGTSPSGGLIGDSLVILMSSDFNVSEAEAIQFDVDTPYGHEHYVTGFRVGSEVTLTDVRANTSTGIASSTATWFRTTSPSAANPAIVVATTGDGRKSVARCYDAQKL